MTHLRNTFSIASLSFEIFGSEAVFFFTFSTAERLNVNLSVF